MTSVVCTLLNLMRCLTDTYLPSGFSEVLFELCRNSSVNVLAAGRVAGNPKKNSL